MDSIDRFRVLPKILGEMIAVSIISHGNANLLPSLLQQVLAFQNINLVILTLNLPERLDLPEDTRLVVVQNDRSKGFGANHNAAFRVAEHLMPSSQSWFFCLINPDVSLPCDPFVALLAQLQTTGAGLAVPVVLSKRGQVEDSLRRFPTPTILLLKALGGDDGRYATKPGQEPFFPQWAAGMFMLFKAECFAALGGFDEGFFLYYEDVDICARAWKLGWPVVACPSVTVVHDARRSSHKQLSYMRWHLASMLRYIFKHWGRLPKGAAT